MKFLTIRKDGGAESTVTGYWLIEVKSLFSVCLLRFDGESRDAFHSHAFNCISWLIKGELHETFLRGHGPCYMRFHWPSWRPFVTRRAHFHKVRAVGTAWVLSIRGPWSRQWREFLPASGEFVTLTHGRAVVRREKGD